MSIVRLLSRRSFLRNTASVSAGVAASLSMPYVARGATDIRFTLPWLAEGSNLIAYVAKANGHWSKAGLNVSIARGYGSVAAAEAIAVGKFDFGLAVASAGIQQVAAGLPLVQIACAGYDATMGICVLDDSPIKTPKELNGKRIASVVTSGEYPFLPLFYQRAGVDAASIHPEAVDATVRERLLIEKRVDAMSGFAISIAPILYAGDYKPRFMLFSKYGIPLYHNSLMTQPARLAKDPGVCEAMVHGLLEAMRFTMLDPEAASAIFFKQVPEMALASKAKERVRVGLGIYIYQVLYPPARHGLGYGAPKDFEAMIDLVMKYVAKPTDKRPTVADVMTNRFVGKLKLTDAEWTRAEAGVKEFKQVLS